MVGSRMHPLSHKIASDADRTGCTRLDRNARRNPTSGQRRGGADVRHTLLSRESPYVAQLRISDRSDGLVYVLARGRRVILSPRTMGWDDSVVA